MYTHSDNELFNNLSGCLLRQKLNHIKVIYMQEMGMVSPEFIPGSLLLQKIQK